jgi:hypothetical protein
MTSVTLRIVLLSFISIFLAGCGAGDPNVARLILKGRPDTDVTSSPEYNFSSFAGTVWKTKVRTALVDVKLYTGAPATYLAAPESFDPAHPKYLPLSGMQGIIAILPVGTRLRIERLIKDNGNWGGVRVTAVLQDAADYRKTVYVTENFLAKNRFVWRGWSESKEWGVNPDMLDKPED